MPKSVSFDIQNSVFISQLLFYHTEHMHETGLGFAKSHTQLLLAKWDIITRYAGFYRELLTSHSREVNIMARLVVTNIRATTTKNIITIGEGDRGLDIGGKSYGTREQCSQKLLTVTEIF